MTDDNKRDDAFDEFLDRAEEDFEAEDEELDEEDGLEGGSLSGAIVSEEMKAQSLMVDMPSAHGEIVEDANGGEGTVVRTAYLGKEMRSVYKQS